MTNHPPQNHIASARTAIIALVAGLLLGMLINLWPLPPAMLLVDFLSPLGALWLSALQMLVLPLMISMLLVAIGRAQTKTAGRMGLLTIACFIAFLAVPALLTVIAGETLLSWLPLSEATVDAFQSRQTAPPTQTEHMGAAQAGDFVRGIIPTNLLQAAVSGNLMGLIVATLMFGLALHRLQQPARDTLLTFLEAVSEWCLELATLLFRALPFAVFILTLDSAANSGAELASGLAFYLVVVCFFLIIATLILYPLSAQLGGIAMRDFARAVWPAQLLAFSTRSSVACLPAMQTVCRKELRLKGGVSGFVLPLAVSSFKYSMGVSAVFQLVFLLHLYGIDAGAVPYALAVIALAAQSVMTPGLPSGAIWTTTPVYLSLGIPIEGIVLVNIIDTIPDLFKTTANVTANISVATLVSNHSREPS